MWRRSDAGAVEVLLVHRPRYGDWTWPKGKLEPDEEPEVAALREVEEETGLRCELGERLDEVRYLDHEGRDKRARYWAMRVVDPAAADSFTPNDEVDEVQWCRVPQARVRLSYEHDTALLDALERVDLPSA